jgi:hypothetical protein
MNKKLVAAVGLLSSVFAAQPAFASHILFEDVKLNGTALDSVSGRTNPTFSLTSAGSLLFSFVSNDHNEGYENSFQGGILGIPGLNAFFSYDTLGTTSRSYSFSLSGVAPGTYSGTAYLESFVSFPNNYINLSGGLTTDPTFNFNLNVASIAGAAPEPATWAMMIGGFGMVGGTMRSARRRQTGVLKTA